MREIDDFLFWQNQEQCKQLKQAMSQQKRQGRKHDGQGETQNKQRKMN